MTTDEATTSPLARQVLRAPFGTDGAGRTVEAFTLRNVQGAEVEVLTLGGIIRAVRVPDRHGVLADVVLGFDDVASYQHDTMYLGALIGRYANRIRHGTFELGGVVYTVTCNDGTNSLHGGLEGFAKRQWQVAPFLRDDTVGLILRLTSEDNDQGFPGRLSVDVTYTWQDDNVLIVDYRADTTAPTPVNLTQHSYFNLRGDLGTNVLAHELTVHASRFTPVHDTLIPTGELRAVEGTPFDFRQPQPIGARLHAHDAQLAMGGGFDHNWVLDRDAAAPIAARVEAAALRDPVSGRTLRIATTEPGLQVYSGNYLGNGVVGKGGVPFVAHGGVALETQHFPDSPNQPHFPSTIVYPGTAYRSSTSFTFRVED